MNNWTDELLNLMIGYLNKRKGREEAALSGDPARGMVSDTELFNQLGNKVKVVKNGH